MLEIKDEEHDNNQVYFQQCGPGRGRGGGHFKSKGRGITPTGNLSEAKDNKKPECHRLLVQVRSFIHHG